MKKIIAILLALAVVSMAFAQTVSISNKLSTSPTITINGGASYWGFGDAAFLRDEVTGEAITADGRAKVKGQIRFDLQTLSPNEESILSFKPRWSWNSMVDNERGEGNRSAVAAILKPWDFLEIGIGNLDRMGYAMSVGACKNLDWREWSTWFHGVDTFANEIPGVVGGWQRLSSLVFDGIHVAYTGVPGLKIGVGFESARNEKNGNGGKDRETLIKKGMFNGFSMGANYDSDFFAVGAIYKGNFGMERGTLAEENDKAYQDHTIYASFAFKGLQEAKIGTTIYADVGFYTAKASKLVTWSYYDANAKTPVANKDSVPVTSFLFNVGAGFNFRNGITDDLAVSVGYFKIGGTSAKVLPFCVINTINYSVSSDANFSFLLGYSQAGLAEKKSVAGAKNTTDKLIGPAGPTATATASGKYGWLVFAYPQFSWTMGASTFNIGLKTGVDGDIVPHAKSGHEWAWTGLRGQQAYISFPLSWTYNF